jgi:hypothetical protein
VVVSIIVHLFFFSSCDTTIGSRTVIVTQALVGARIFVADAKASVVCYWKSRKACAKRGLAPICVYRVTRNTTRGAEVNRATYFATRGSAQSDFRGQRHTERDIAIESRTSCAFFVYLGTLRSADRRAKSLEKSSSLRVRRDRKNGKHWSLEFAWPLSEKRKEKREEILFRLHYCAASRHLQTKRKGGRGRGQQQQQEREYPRTPSTSHIEASS